MWIWESAIIILTLTVGYLLSMSWCSIWTWSVSSHPQLMWKGINAFSQHMWLGAAPRDPRNFFVIQSRLLKKDRGVFIQISSLRTHQRESTDWEPSHTSMINLRNQIDNKRFQRAVKWLSNASMLNPRPRSHATPELLCAALQWLCKNLRDPFTTVHYAAGSADTTHATWC